MRIRKREIIYMVVALSLALGHGCTKPERDKPGQLKKSISVGAVAASKAVK